MKVKAVKVGNERRKRERSRKKWWIQVIYSGLENEKGNENENDTETKRMPRE